MRKSIAFVFGVLFLFASAQAAVTVKQDGKTTKYKNGSVVTVNGKSDTTVTYNGVKFFVPKGVTVTLAQENGNVIVRGSNLTGVRVGDMTLASDGPAVFTVTPDTEVVSVRQGTLTVTAKDGSSTIATNGNSFATSAEALKNAQKAGSTAAAGEDVPEFVAADAVTDTASQQATQNVVESEEVLSPSAPR